MPCCRGCRSLNYLFGGDNCLKASKGKAYAQWPRHPVHPAATGNERIPAADIVTLLPKDWIDGSEWLDAMVGFPTENEEPSPLGV